MLFKNFYYVMLALLTMTSPLYAEQPDITVSDQKLLKAEVKITDQPILIIRFNKAAVNFTNAAQTMVEEALKFNANMSFRLVVNIKSIGNKLSDAAEQNIVLAATHNLEKTMIENGVAENKIHTEIREDSSALVSDIKLYLVPPTL